LTNEKAWYCDVSRKPTGQREEEESNFAESGEACSVVMKNRLYFGYILDVASS